MHAGQRPRLSEEQREWLADLHVRLFDRMRRIAIRSLPPPDAEDVVQIVFAEALQAALELPQVRIGDGWLIRRLRSRIIDYHRRSSRQQRLLAAVLPFE